MNGRKITSKGEPFYFFYGEGSDYEVGFRMGREMAADILFSWDFFLPRMEEVFGTPPDKYAETYKWLRENLENIAPWMVEQICGMAEGSGISIEKLFILNHYPLLWSSHGLFCSTVAVRDTEVGPVLAQNLEIGSDDLYFVQEIHPENGNAILSCGMAGMCFSSTGINSCGLAVGSSNLPSPVREGEKPHSGGVPYFYQYLFYENALMSLNLYSILKN